MFTRFKHWLILKLGGELPHHCTVRLWDAFPESLRRAAADACEKVVKDPSFKNYEGSNLGRNIKRDEAAEWTKLYLKDLGVAYHDSDVHLACELYYHVELRQDAQ